MAGKNSFRQEVVEKLTMIFAIGCRKIGSFRYVGLEIKPERNAKTKREETSHLSVKIERPQTKANR